MSPTSSLKALLVTAVAADRFRMAGLDPSVVAGLLSRQISNRYNSIQTALGEPLSRYVFRGMMRSSFLIEIVKAPKIETTKFEVHWSERLDQDDPRYASYEDCLEIFERTITTLADAVNNPANREILQLFAQRSLLPYEIPLDYSERRMDGHIHRCDNVVWLWDDLPRRVVKLRSFLLDPDVNPYAQVFGIAYEKIKVKTYLTDRVLTGVHKTNREKRWETHPASVHFALRRSCLEVELTVVNQLCHFEGFPVDLKERLDKAGLCSAAEEPFRCPITMDPLSFQEFEKEIRDPRHGKANFQVGHLNPLKAVNNDPHSGHTAQNISWVSSDGNRIQGHLSLEETRALIRRIIGNYERLGIK